MELSRREFIKTGAMGALAASLLAGCDGEVNKETRSTEAGTKPPQGKPTPPEGGEMEDGYGPPQIVGHSNGIPMRVLGKTGRVVTILGLGGHMVVQSRETDKAVEGIRRAYDLGIRYLDTAQNYGNGQSESNYGEALVGIDRNTYYINTKTISRSYDAAMRDIEGSLKRLRLDHVDSILVHGVDSRASVEEAFAPNGAIKAIEKARDQGMTRFIGVSGHANPQSINLAMDRYDGFDVALLAINPADSRRLPFEKSCYLRAIKAGLGVINMKPLGGGGGMLKSKDGIFEYRELMNYSWSLKGHVTITAVNSVQELEEAVDAAKHFTQITREQKAEMEKRAEALDIMAALGFRNSDGW